MAALDRIGELMEEGETQLAVCSGTPPWLAEEMHRQPAQTLARGFVKVGGTASLMRYRSVLVATDRRILFSERVAPLSAGDQVPPQIRAFPWREVRIDVARGPEIPGRRGEAPFPTLSFSRLYRWSLGLTTPSGTYQFLDVNPPHKLRAFKKLYVRAHPEIPKTKAALPPNIPQLLGKFVLSWAVLYAALAAFGIVLFVLLRST